MRQEISSNGPITWLLVILINVTVTGIIAIYSSQQILRLQHQVGQWRTIHYLGNHQQGRVYGNGNKMLGVYNAVEAGETHMGREEEPNPWSRGKEELAVLSRTERSSSIKESRRTKKKTPSTRKRKRNNQKINGKTVRQLKNKVNKLEGKLSEVLKTIRSLNATVGKIGKVKTSHFVPKTNIGQINRRSVEQHTGVYTLWAEETSNDRDTFSFSDSNGRVRILSSGRYLIYAQVSYRPTQQLPAYTIKRKPNVGNEQILDTCMTIPNAKPDTPDPDEYAGQYIMCNTVTVSSLDQGDHLYIAYSPLFNQSVFAEREKTFWGLVKLGA